MVKKYKNSYKKIDFNVMHKKARMEFNKKQKYDLQIYYNFFK